MHFNVCYARTYTLYDTCVHICVHTCMYVYNIMYYTYNIYIIYVCTIRTRTVLIHYDIHIVDSSKA